MSEVRHEICDRFDAPEGAHTLNWINGDFAYCPGCDLLFTRQPGILVWVYDPWACRLATALLAAQAESQAVRLGYLGGEVPLPVDDVQAAEDEKVSIG